MTDRPGDWGAVFDRLVAAAESAGDLVILSTIGDDEAAYAAANEVIIKESQALAQSTLDGTRLRLVAVIVWEGSARAGTDASGALLTLATKAGFEERIVLTN